METDTSENISNKTIQVKISRLAIIAISLALCGLILFFAGIKTSKLPKPLDSREPLYAIFLELSLLFLFSGFILGIISMIKIEISGGKITGNNFAVGAILVSIFSGFLSFGTLFVTRFHTIANRMVCGTSLSGIGKAILIYAYDYDDKLPRAGGENSTWGTSVKWNAETREQAFGLNSDGTGGQATISSSLYLLIKYAEVTPKSFICKGDKKMSLFEPEKYGSKNKDLTDLWDFGPEPWRHNSYSYSMPYGPYPLTSSSNSDIAVTADRNPWIPSLGWKVKNFAAFNPDGDKNVIKIGNAPTHANEGQNVLYLDTHVNFETTSLCGINKDNIYTSWNGSDIRKGTPPKVGSQPASNIDSLLVNDPPAKKQ